MRKPREFNTKRPPTLGQLLKQRLESNEKKCLQSEVRMSLLMVSKKTQLSQAFLCKVNSKWDFFQIWHRLHKGASDSKTVPNN